MEKTSPPKLFDPKRITALEARAFRRATDETEFLYKLAAETIFERLSATNRNFELAVDLFNNFSPMTDLLKRSDKTSRVIGVNSLSEKIHDDTETKFIHALDREFLPFKKNSVNLVASVFGLHRVNDLPGMLLQINHALMPDGLLTACLPGDRTLGELRACLIEAESTLAGGVSMRVDPFVELRQAGSLLQRAGFALPVVDSELLTIRYDSLRDIVADMRAMAATSAFVSRPGFGPRNLFQLADEIYREKYADDDGRLRVTVEVIYLSGWKPDPSQQKPLKPGSAIKSLKDVL